MTLRLDLRTVSRAMRIARRLTADHSPEGLSLFRELLASLMDSRQFLEVIEPWIVPVSESLATGNVFTFCQKLPAIVRTFGASGYRTEAVRVMATGAGLVPALTRELIEATGLVFSHPSSKAVPARVAAAAEELNSVGLDLLEAGSPEGITLIGAAHRVAPGVAFPIKEIRERVHDLQGRRPMSWQIADAQAVTDAAYDLHFSGRLDPAARVATLVPSGLPGTEADQLFKQLEASAKPEAKAAFVASREILERGYPAEAANLLLDSGSVSTEDIWVSLDRSVIGPNAEIETPKRFDFYKRSVRNYVSPAAIGPPDSSFYFVLEGKDARCDQVVWGATFDLVFRYDVLSAEALAQIKGKKLANLLKKPVDLRIDIYPEGLKLEDDIAGRIAHFDGGKMIGEPPRFRLTAPKQDPGARSEACGIYVSLSFKLAQIYSFFLEIHLVERLDTGPCANHVLDLDLEQVTNCKAEPRTASIFVYTDGDAWTAHWDIDGVQGKPRKTTLSASRLDAAYKDFDILTDLTAIAKNAVWKEVDPELKIPAKPASQSAALACMQTAMTAGSKLYLIFSEDPVLNEALGLIEKLPEGSKIAITTDGVTFPWELFYPLRYDHGQPAAHYKPDRFWGRRFQIESLLFAASPAEKLPEQRQQIGKLYVGMGLNEGIDSEWAGRPLLPVEFQKKYCDQTLKDRGQHSEKWDDIIPIFSQPYQASLIYLFCHGKANQLEFDKSHPPVTPISFSDEIYPGWPIVFLNACEAGDISPLSFFSFRKQFRKKQAAGLIAPSFPIPTLFAAVFAKAVLEKYTAHDPIGKILFDLRAQLLDDNNPLGLWYSLQCPLDVMAPVQ